MALFNLFQISRVVPLCLNLRYSATRTATEGSKLPAWGGSRPLGWTVTVKYVEFHAAHKISPCRQPYFVDWRVRSNWRSYTYGRLTDRLCFARNQLNFEFGPSQNPLYHRFFRRVFHLGGFAVSHRSWQWWQQALEAEKETPLKWMEGCKHQRCSGPEVQLLQSTLRTCLVISLVGYFYEYWILEH